MIPNFAPYYPVLPLDCQYTANYADCFWLLGMGTQNFSNSYSCLNQNWQLDPNGAENLVILQSSGSPKMEF